MPDDRRRAFQIYLYTACLIAVIVFLFSAAQAIYSVVRIAAPGTTAAASEGSFPFNLGGDNDVSEDAERDRGTSDLIQNGIMAIVAALVFAFHWQRASRLDAPAIAPPITPRPVDEGRRRPAPPPPPTPPARTRRRAPRPDRPERAERPRPTERAERPAPPPAARPPRPARAAPPEEPEEPDVIDLDAEEFAVPDSRTSKSKPARPRRRPPPQDEPEAPEQVPEDEL